MIKSGGNFAQQKCHAANKYVRVQNARHFDGTGACYTEYGVLRETALQKWQPETQKRIKRVLTEKAEKPKMKKKEEYIHVEV